MAEKKVISGELMSQMGLFERVTKARLKTALQDSKNRMIFVVEEGELGKALGKEKRNLMKLKQMFKKPIKIVEFHPVLETFVAKMVHPVVPEHVEEQEGVVFIKPASLEDRGKLIGRMGSNLRDFETIARNFFKVEEIKVV